MSAVTGSVASGTRVWWLAHAVKNRWASDWWARPGKKIFFQISNSAQIYKLKMEAFCCPKNIQILHGAIFELSKQLYQLHQLQILNKIHEINSRTEFNLRLLWILKGFKPYGKHLVNSLKFYLNMIFTKVNLGWHTCMQKFGVLIQVSKWINLKIRNEFEFEIPPHTTYNTVHSETLLQHCMMWTSTPVIHPHLHVIRFLVWLLELVHTN
jgi:hypothetical protein